MKEIRVEDIGKAILEANRRASEVTSYTWILLRSNEAYRKGIEEFLFDLHEEDRSSETSYCKLCHAQYVWGVPEPMQHKPNCPAVKLQELLK